MPIREPAKFPLKQHQQIIATMMVCIAASEYSYHPNDSDDNDKDDKDKEHDDVRNAWRWCC